MQLPSISDLVNLFRAFLFKEMEPGARYTWFWSNEDTTVATFPSTSRAKPAIARRTQVVWASFIAAMSIAIGLLSLDSRSMTTRGFPLTNLRDLDEVNAAGHDSLFDLATPLDNRRWTGIVIHHLGATFGTPETVHRQHLGFGYQGLGYHFLIGNGNGLADGEIHAGYRWDYQLPGAHVIGPEGDLHNGHSIGICLVGNGDRRPFTDQQMAQLIRLVQRLQQELGIPGTSVRLHGDLAPGINSPGRYFEYSRLAEQLLDVAR